MPPSALAGGGFLLVRKRRATTGVPHEVAEAAPRDAGFGIEVASPLGHSAPL